MRILHLLNHTRRLNGHVHAAIDLACAQVKLGHTVALASEGGDFDAFLRDNGVENVRVPHERKVPQLVKGLLSLQRFVRSWDAEVVHAHMMTSAVLAWPVCQLATIPLVTTVHNEFEKSAILMGLGTRVIAVSAAVRDSMARRGIPKAKLHVILNGTIGSARCVGKDRSPRALEKPAILFVGGLHPRKGIPDLLTAFDTIYREFPTATLSIVGGGPMEAAYIELARTHASGVAVQFMGALDDPFPFLLGADVFVLPSHADPAPLVLSEAREAGCAIVATNVDGIPEMLEGGQAGVLVAPRAPEELASAVLGLLRQPDELRELRARSQVNIGYMGIERVAEQAVEVYRAASGRSAVSARLAR